MARVSPARDSCKLAVDEQVPVRDGPRHDRCSTTAVRRGTTTYDVRTASVGNSIVMSGAIYLMAGLWDILVTNLFSPAIKSVHLSAKLPNASI